MDDMQEKATGTVPEGQGNTGITEQAAETTAEITKRPWYKVPVITIPAILALLVMVYIFLRTVYTSMLRYNVIEGINSPFIGLRNYENIRTDWLVTAVFNTIGIRLLTLLACSGLAAAMCVLYRKMEKSGPILTAACLWLIPVGIPAALIGAPVMNAVQAPNVFTCALAYLAGSGLQTLGIFCFAAGIFAYLKKNPFHGLLAAVLAWLLKNIGLNAMDAGIHTRIPVSLLTDERNFLSYMSAGTAHSAALCVVKIVLQVAIGTVAAVLICRRIQRKGLVEKTTRAEMILIPAAVLCVALANILYEATGGIADAIAKSIACSLLVALGGGAAGGLIAWSFVRLLKGASGRLFVMIALVLSAAMSCLMEQYLLVSHLELWGKLPLIQALFAAFDGRVILLVVILALILRFKTGSRPVGLFLSLALLAGACTWGGIVSAMIYDSADANSVGMLFYTQIWSNHIVERIPGDIESGIVSRETLNMIMAVPPLLMGIGAAFLMKRAFKNIPEKE